MIVWAAPSFCPVAGPAVAHGNVRLHPDDRFDAGLASLLLELPGGMEVTVIGNGEGGLLEFQGTPDQVVNPVGAVEQRILGMTMEMYERHIIRICDA